MTTTAIVSAKADRVLSRDNNRLVTYDGYRYDYDDEGNRIRSYVDVDGSESFTAGDTDVTTYEWDHRNRLTKVIDSEKTVTHFYDAFNQWVGEAVTGSITLTRNYIYDSGQIVMEYEDDVMQSRNLWALATDQLLAVEKVTSETAPGEVHWPLTDHLGSIRDIVDTKGTLRKHTTYDSFGNELEEDFYDASGFGIDESHAEAVDSIFGFTARPKDDQTGLQNNLHRWYDAGTGRWLSQDPIGFEAGDANLYRYVGNEPTMRTDPTGLKDDYDLFGEVLERWRVNGGIVEIHHIFHQQFYRNNRALGQWLISHGFAMNSGDNLIPLVGRKANFSLATRFARTLHIGSHTRSCVRAVEQSLRRVMVLEQSGRITADAAKARIAAIQARERQLLRTGGRMLHRPDTVARHIAKLRFAVPIVTPLTVALDVAMSPGTAHAAEPAFCYPIGSAENPERMDDVLFVTIVLERKRYRRSTYVTEHQVLEREVVNTHILREDALTLDGISEVLSGTDGEEWVETSIEVYVHDEHRLLGF